MKKIISIILVLAVVMILVSCRKAGNDLSSTLSTTSDVEVSMPQSSTEFETQLSPQNPIDEKVYQSSTLSTTSDVEVSMPQSSTESETQLSPQNPIDEKVYQSTVDTPKEVIFYKDGKYGISTNQTLNLQVAKSVEAWYKDYENDTIPLTKTAVTEEMIAKLKYNETVIEICFDYDQEINLLGKIELENTRRLLIPLTGDQAYYVFRGNSEYKYRNGLHAVNGSELEKYFEGVALDKNVNNWQSTVIAPASVTFYKDGMQSVSTDKDLYLKIIKHIESWFQHQDSIAIASLSATTDLINKIKRKEMAIELQFDDEIKFYGGVINEDTRTLFIPITGEYAYDIFKNTIKSPNYWGGPISGGEGLEQFFDEVQFTPLTEEEKRWRSTITTPGVIEFYENGKLIGKSENMSGYEFNNKIAKHIESWFYKRENVATTTISNTPVETAWGNGSYIKMWFGNAPQIYGEQIIDKAHSYVIIPITGDYAYNIFSGTYEEMSNTMIEAQGYDLEQFFDEFKSKQ